MDESLTSSQRKLSEEFFRRQDAELLQKLRDQLGRNQQREQLAQATGIHQPALLDELLQAGISAEALPALKLVPLVTIAWSDAVVQEGERQAILQAAINQGVREASPAYQLLQRWLEQRPPASLVAAWKQYVATLCTALSPGGVRMLREEVMDGAEHVARAAGGFLGLQSISAGEAAMLKELQGAFPGAD